MGGWWAWDRRWAGFVVIDGGGGGCWHPGGRLSSSSMVVVGHDVAMGIGIHIVVIVGAARAR